MASSGSPRRVGAIARVCAANKRIRAGEHEPIAVVAVEVPRAGAAVDDRLEGAESALGGRGAPRQVDRQRLGLSAGHRRELAGEQLARLGGAGPATHTCCSTCSRSEFDRCTSCSAIRSLTWPR